MPGKKLSSDPVSLIHPRSLKNLNYHLHSHIRGRLWLKILLGMALGIITGLALGPSTGLVDGEVSYIIGEWLALPGYIFLALLQMIVIPLVVASIIRGIAAGEDMEQLRQVGIRTVGYFLVTTAFAILIGLGLALLIGPGNYISSEMVQQTLGTGGISAQDSTADVLVSSPVDTFNVAEVPGMITTILPTNPLGALATGQMLQVVIFSIIIGVALVSMAPAQSKPLLELLGSLQEVSMTVVRWSMLLAPVAVFGLICKFTINLGIDALLGMLVYVGTVLLGLLILLVTYLVIVYAVSKKGPFTFIQSIRDVLLLAFSTSSSAAVMPLSIKTAEEKIGVRPSISQFVIPLGATINMNGTALYQSIAAVFLAQVFGVELGFGALLLLMITVVGASIGTPSTPGVGIVILALILTSVGIPTAGIALIIGVDRILDMSRTAVNVTGDLVACVVMDKWVGGKNTAIEEVMNAERDEMQRRKLGEDVIVN